MLYCVAFFYISATFPFATPPLPTGTTHPGFISTWARRRLRLARHLDLHHSPEGFRDSRQLAQRVLNRYHMFQHVKYDDEIRLSVFHGDAFRPGAAAARGAAEIGKLGVGAVLIPLGEKIQTLDVDSAAA